MSIRGHFRVPEAAGQNLGGPGTASYPLIIHYWVIFYRLKVITRLVSIHTNKDGCQLAILDLIDPILCMQ